MSASDEQVENSGLLHHGGRLRAAAVDYGRPLEQWLDLSTGINPCGWPVPDMPSSVWVRLPEADDGLQTAARNYYGAENILPVAGSQAAIQALPWLRAQSRVLVLEPSYAEHAAAWRRAGHEVIVVTEQTLEAWLVDADVLVVCHPNNPTGTRFSVSQLRDWHARLAARDGWLVLDEAFMDATPEHSLCGDSHQTGLIVLRSLGKFFGLAGARVGFVCAAPGLLSRLNIALGPWTVSAPARWVARAALEDRRWQTRTRGALTRDSARLKRLLTHYRLTPDGGCALFQWIQTPHAQAIHEALAYAGILTRLYAHTSSLRFGLPGTECDWARLDIALCNEMTRDTAESATAAGSGYANKRLPV